jgi:hypothetical protein
MERSGLPKPSGRLILWVIAAKKWKTIYRIAFIAAEDIN